jgi:WD40 repeat protein
MTTGSSGQWIVTAGDDHLLRIWDAASLQLVARLEGHGDWVQAVGSLPNARKVISAGQDGRILVWDFETAEANPGRVGPVQIDQWPEAVRALAVSPDGQLLAAATFSGKVALYDLNETRRVRILEGPGPDIRTMAFSPNGRLLAGGDRRGKIRLWESATWTTAADLAAHRGRVQSLAFSADSRQLASGGRDRRLILWDLETGGPLANLPQPAHVFALAWCSPERIAVAGSDNVIRLLRLPSGQEVARLVGHTGTVTALLWQPDRQQLLSGSYDTTIRVWKVTLPDAVALVP